MKTILTLILSCCCLWAFGDNKTFSKLAEVNKCWAEQKDLPQLPAYTILGEREWIKLHLSLVEQTLRARDVSTLTAAQKQNRGKSLDDLHQYWQSGRFPVNDAYAYRTPIFIDKYDNFCAVGYLVKASGHEAVSRKIAANTNLAYVRQMNYPELTAWAAEYGFTVDELAWIQPGYPPEVNAKPVGGGVDGEVLELYADNTEGKLYVGGNFTVADGTVYANNIAYVTENNGVFTWHDMNKGINGEVHAIEKFDNKIFIAGHFTMSVAGSTALNNVAYWNGNAWQPAGCTYGTIKDLIVYKNELYAVGDFDVCAALSEVNLAKWTGTYWQQMPGLEGHVNTVEIWEDKLVLGGTFTYNGQHANVIKWDPVNYFQPFGNTIGNEVKDFGVYKGELHAATHYTGGSQTDLLQVLKSGSWQPKQTIIFPNIDNTVTYNTLCADVDTFIVGGKFTSAGMTIIGSGIANCFNVPAPGVYNNDWFMVDDEINKLTVFKGKLFAGGKFKKDTDQPAVPLNGIGYKLRKYGQGVDDVKNASGIHVYPNPATKTLQLEGVNAGTGFEIHNLQGQKLMSGKAGNTIDISSLPPGNYLIRMTNGDDSGIQFVKD